MKNDIIIRPENPSDYRTVENLTREAFWNVYRPGCLEHFVLKKFRDDEDFVKELDFVLEIDGRIAGHIMFAKCNIKCDDGSLFPVLTFGPVSITPEFQRHGLGKMLLDYALEKAEEQGYNAVAMTGNIAFYSHCGFVSAKTTGVRYQDDPNADYFLIKELKKGCLDGINGTFKEPDGYFVCEKLKDEFELYEKTFPEKEKLKLPGQLV